MNITSTHLQKLTAVAMAVGLFSCGGGSESNTKFDLVNPAEPVSDWTLVWSDEFDGASIDKNKWTHEINCNGGGNNEQQCYSDSAENSFVSGGTLKIVAKPAEEGAPLPYTSARLNTRYKADFKYGRFEMRAKLPSGQGSWPAFWMLPTDYVYGEWPKSGEIDILEAVNLKVADSEGNVEANVHGTLHYGQAWPANKQSGKAYLLPEMANPADDFHTYAIEWQEGEIRWYVDDYLFATQMKSEVRYNGKGEAVGLKHRGWFAEYFDIVTGELTTHWDNAPFDQDFHLLLNLAVGGNWAGNVNNTGIDAAAFADGQTYEIDYVHVYECAINPNTGKGCETIRAGYKVEASDENPTGALVIGEAPIPSPPSTGIATPITIFADAENAGWPVWDCCGGTVPTIETDNAEHGATVEFVIGAAPTVMGFNSRLGSPAKAFDASPMLTTGSIKFDMKVVSMPSNSSAPWLFKAESNDATTAVEMDLTLGNDGNPIVAGEWQHYEFSLQTLADAGLDLSGIDVLMIFPAWGAGEGAVYRVDNVEISQDGPVVYPELVLFSDQTNLDWPIWDCCGGSTPVEAMDDAEHGLTAEFAIGAAPTVMGFLSAEGVSFDASEILVEGVVQFDMKVVSAPSDASAAWLFKVEAGGATSAVELPLTSSIEGIAPVTGQWQTYTFTLQSLSDAGLDVSEIDVVMVFPAWGAGNGAVYRIDNAKIYNPNAPEVPEVGLTLFKDMTPEQWSIWDCCGGSTPSVETDDAQHGSVAQFSIGAAPTVMGFLAADDVYYDASALLASGVVRFDMKLVSAPSDASAPWLFKIEAGDASSAVELPLSASLEGVDPVVGQWQTYTFTLQSLFDAGLDISQIDVVMVFPAWGAGNGAVYRIDNAAITIP
ncbi:glycoside hydrolase family 16 protein [Paraglaciecola hydrolytica]|uniref:Glycosyl hydrolase family 16 n=1 Tax=Paraglaciecola hydrolytica TaxID=1799789 RepID=A0A148KND7_9ALTE|nr:glycoside hydrolase family 16 protein [Paraglaciecola hydrolytica]KXI27748.1 glycosyl hydrolase family 16 [Paraglaciecola hydrolytica]